MTINARKLATNTILAAALQLQECQAIYGIFFTSTVFASDSLFWMNDTMTGYYRINLASGEVVEVAEANDETPGKFVNTNDILVVARAIINFMLMCGNKVGFAVSLPQISHYVLDTIGYRVTTRGANESDLTLWASHDYYLGLGKVYAGVEMEYGENPKPSWILKNGQTLSASRESDSEIVFTFFDGEKLPLKPSLLEIRNALREMVQILEKS